MNIYYLANTIQLLNIISRFSVNEQKWEREMKLDLIEKNKNLLLTADSKCHKLLSIFSKITWETKTKLFSRNNLDEFVSLN